MNNNNKSVIINELKLFAESFPSLRILEKYCDRIDLNNPSKITEVCSIFIVVELLNLYYRRFDYPLYKVIRGFIKLINLCFNNIRII